MDSPLARVILTLLGGYLIILLLLIAHDWVRKEYPSPPAGPPDTTRIQHPLSHEQAVTALERFNRLPKSERDRIKESLETCLWSLKEWLIDLEHSNYGVICMGEFHEESTRNFLAKEFFTSFSHDVLMLETTPGELEDLRDRVEAGRTYFPLLDADIMNILRTAGARNPDLEICAIEETDKQQEEQRGQQGSRDKSIARNFWSRYRPGKRHVILFGALHCTNEPNWLFESLRAQAPASLKNRMLNAQVLGEHQNGPLEAFVFFLDEIGIDKRGFVIPDTRALHPLIYEWFQVLNHQTLEKYRTLIVFRRWG